MNLHALEQAAEDADLAVSHELEGRTDTAGDDARRAFLRLGEALNLDQSAVLTALRSKGPEIEEQTVPENDVPAPGSTRKISSWPPRKRDE